MLTLGVAVASPVMQPQTLEMICTSGGVMQMVVIDDEGPVKAGPHHALDCPLCLVAAAPPLHLAVDFAQPQPLGLAVQPLVAARIAALVGAPLPARGPPARV